MSIEQEVIKFVSDFTSVDKNKLSLSTLINDDLGLDGDDGWEFLEKYSEKFGVNLEGIDKRYFGGEGFSIFSLMMWPIVLLLHFLGWKTKMFSDCSPLSIETLVKSAEAKVWID